MRFVFLCLLLAAAAFADPVKDLEDELVAEGDDIDKVHEVIDELDAKERDELAPKGDDEEKLEELKEEEEKEHCDKEAPMKEDLEHSGQPDINELNEAAGLEKDLFEGDLMLNMAQMMVIAEADAAGNRTRRQALKNAGYSWGQNPTIQYRYQSGYPTSRYQTIEAAMKFWSDRTCINFARAGSGPNIVEVRESSGCSSAVGKVGGVQPLNLAQGCMSVGTIAHELSHTFGIFHVQSRYDRDAYVMLDTSNIQRGMEHNFKVEGQDTTTLFGLPYEFGSNMHYGAGDFGVDRNRPVLYAKDANRAYQNGMMGRLPTFYDINLVNQHYNCYANCPSKPACQNNGVVDVRNCRQCMCPMGWTGALCDQRPAGTQTLTATANAQTLNIDMGTYGASNALTYQTKYYVIQAPAGRRISITPTYKGTQWSNSCSGMGAEVQFKKDKRLAGTQICDFRVTYEPITSEDNTVVIQAYTLGGQVSMSFSYRAV